MRMRLVVKKQKSMHMCDCHLNFPPKCVRVWLFPDNRLVYMALFKVCI